VLDSVLWAQLDMMVWLESLRSDLPRFRQFGSEPEHVISSESDQPCGKAKNVPPFCSSICTIH
jgi:hypothetical protein